MEVKTKFNIGDPVVIKGQRYRVQRITVNLMRDRASNEVRQQILVYGEKTVHEDSIGTIEVGDAAMESDVVADPLV